MKKLNQRVIIGMVAVALTLSFSGGPSAYAAELIQVDGSSTVYPITEAVAEEFRYVSPDSKVTVGISGTGGGFKRFCRKETDISDASRVIKSSEVKLCAENNVQYVELPVAFDGLAVVVHPSNDWATHMTVAELKKLWEPEAQDNVVSWNQIRSDWPNEPITLAGPGTDSGTYDYFTKAIVGKSGASRGDFIASEDDNVLVQAVSNDPYALGFFGVAYYEENKDKLKLVAIDDENDSNGRGPQHPTSENVIKGFYQPLARPIFIYVRLDSSAREEIQSFVEFYLKEAPSLVSEVGYIPLPSNVYSLALERFRKRVTGSAFAKRGSTVGVPIDEILKG